MADAPDSKSGMGNSMCGFDPRLRYFRNPAEMLGFFVSMPIALCLAKRAERRQNLPKYASKGVARRNPIGCEMRKAGLLDDRQ